MTPNTKKTVQAFDIAQISDKDLATLKTNSFMKALSANGIILSPKEDAGLKLHTKTQVSPDLLKAISEQKQALYEYLTQPITLENPQGPYPLSEQQEGLWLAYQADPSSSAYNEPLILSLPQHPNIDAIRYSIEAVHMQLPILRVRFSHIDGIPCQWVADPSPIEELFRYQPERISDIEYRKQLHEMSLTPFDLSREALFRVGLFLLQDGSAKLVLVLPHILTDGWATMNLVDKIAAYYQDFLQGKSQPLALKTPQYEDIVFVSTNDSHLKAAERLNFWAHHFEVESEDDASFVEPAVLPALYTPNANDNNTLRMEVPSSLASQLVDISRQLHVSDASTCLAIYSIAFSKAAMLDEFIVSTPFANRSELQAQDYMGLLVNTLPIRVQVARQTSLAEHIQSTHQKMLEYIELQDTPLELILNQSSLQQKLSGEHVFQSVFEYQTFDSHVRFGDQTASFDETPSQHSKFPLTFLLRKGDNLLLEIEFDPAVYHRQHIADLANAFITVLNALLTNKETPIAAISLLGATPEQSLTTEAQQFIDTTFNYSQMNWNERYQLPFTQINELLYQRVLQNPDKIAVKTKQGELSYRAVFGYSLQLAEQITAKAAKPEAVIGVFMPTCRELLISMTATFLSGKTYLPLDPALPDQRLQNILKKSQCQILICPQSLQARLTSIIQGVTESEQSTNHSIDVIGFEDHIHIKGGSTSISSMNIPALPDSAMVHPKQLAYAIFTSGSSGEPKGAMIEHAGMLNHLLAKAHDVNITSDTTLGFIATPSFDVSIWQMLCALTVGGTTAIFEGEAAWDPEPLFQQINQQHVNLIETVPSHLNALLDYCESVSPQLAKVPNDFLLMLNGEPLLREQCLRWQTLFPHSQLVNAYGLTEVSDDTCHFHIHSSEVAKQYQCMPISGTLPNMELYILDQDLCPVPQGTKGELYIGGIAVGRGYLDDPRRTAERFIPDPFSSQLGARLYRSGDIVWADQQGAIHFLGRNDFQIKVRGFRIEVQEIENAIHQIAGVDNVAVMVDGLGDQKQILAFYQTSRLNSITAESIREHLLATLPQYMVPDTIIGYESFPLTTNGKIDRKSLLANSQAEKQQLTDTADNQFDTDTQRKLASIFASTLNIACVGKHQSFFTIGGNSLIALRIVNQIRSEFSVQVKVSDILKNETVAKLAALVEQQSYLQSSEDNHDVMAALNAIAKQLPPATSKLTPYQLPEWYMYRVEPENPYYNISFPNIFFKGDLNADAFLTALRYMIARHRALRSRFSTHQGEPIVTYDDSLTIQPAECFVEHLGLSDTAIEQQIVAYADHYNHLTLDLGQCCFETKLIKYRDDYYQFIWVVHHIIWDETSTLIFFDELSSAYNAIAAGQTPRLPELPFDYSDFERTINDLLTTPAMQTQKAYWDQHLQSAPTLVNLPTDRPRQPSQTFNGDGVLFHFDAAEKQQIEAYLAHHNTTLFIYLLAILNLELYKITGETDQVIGAPIANRDSDGLQTLIGLFATALPLRSRLNPQQSFAEFLTQSKNVATDGFDNHNYPSIYALRDNTKAASSTNVNRFNIMYGVQNDKTQWKQRIDFAEVEYIERDEIGITEGNTARFDLTIVVDYVDDAIEVYFNFNTDLFNKDRIQFYLDGFKKLVLDTLSDDSKKLHQYSIISAKHPQWSASFIAGESRPVTTSNPTLHDLVLHACEQYPALIAINDHGETYTYAQLKQGVAQYLHELNQYEIHAEAPVVVYAGHSISAICAMLAILYKGGTYIPLFASTPAERALEVIAQTQAKLVFVSDSSCHFASIQQQANTLVLPLEAALDKVITQAQQLFATPSSVVTEQLAYNVFTSGTTGKPKGIAVTHQSILNTINATIAQHQFTQTDNILLLTESHFDPYFLDVFCALATGAQLIIVPECERKTPSKILENIAEHEISFFQGTPTFLDSLCQEMSFSQTQANHVRVIITGGEQVTPATVTAIHEAFPNASLANHYGPSEVAVDAVSTILDNRLRTSVPIGKPIANTAAVVMDENLEAVPFNHVGELYVLSPGLARGYVNHPALTAERFMPSPYARFAGERMYRTGDKVRMDAHGQIHFMGREDEQLKINGSRVELTEIEAVISAQQGVDVAAVIYHAQEAGGYLAAYLKMTNPRHKVTGKSKRFSLFPLAQKPTQLNALTQLHAQSWPEFFAADIATKRYWSELNSTQANDQLLLLDEQQQLAGAIHSTRIFWDGNSESLAGGWSQAIAQGIQLGGGEKTTPAANTLVALAALVSPQQRGEKLSTVLLEKIKEHAIAQGMSRCIIPIRVTAKSRYPEMSFEDYALGKNKQGEALDPWLNIHLTAGARILGIAEQSQHMVARVDDWQKWLGITLNQAGIYQHPELHSHLSVNANGEASYDEPCIWVEHPLEKAETAPQPFAEISAIRESVSRILPSYMIPSVWHSFTELPSNINGKIDKAALQALEISQGVAEIQAPQGDLACRIHEIWQRVLKQSSFGVRCNFFMIGGHSINALQCLEEINRQFDADIQLKAFLLNPTIDSICHALTQAKPAQLQEAN